jgi:hypothetical protein
LARDIVVFILRVIGALVVGFGLLFLAIIQWLFGEKEE